jgi:hypothetical protein
VVDTEIPGRIAGGDLGAGGQDHAKRLVGELAAGFQSETAIGPGHDGDPAAGGTHDRSSISRCDETFR